MKGGPLRAALPGILFALAYPLGTPGYDVPGIPFLCLAPLLRLSSEAPGPRPAALRGFLAGTAANVPVFYWIAWTVAVEGRLGWALGSLSALLVSAYAGVYVSLSAWAAHRLERRFGESAQWAFPAVWTAAELGRSVLLTGFPWILVGYGLAGDPRLRQAADLAGVAGLGFLLALSGTAFHRATVCAAGSRWRSAAVPLGVVAAVPAFLFAYGSFRMGAADAGRLREVPAIRVGVVQGRIDQSVKWDPGNQRETIRVYRELTAEAAAAGAEAVVWPETAAPFFYGWERELSAEVERVARENRVPLIFGAPWYDPSGGGRYYNSVFLLGPDGVPRARYDKRHLVPFGEYIPLKPLLSFLRKLTPGDEDFSAGTGPRLFPVLGTRAGASICYEALFPGILRDSVRAGASWLVNVTNDAWFGDTVAPRQHLAMARMRTVELRRPMVRAANTGISEILDARGQAQGRLDLLRRGVFVATVVPGQGETVYGKTGEIFAVSCTIIIILLLIAPVPGRGAPGPRGRRERRDGDRDPG